MISHFVLKAFRVHSEHEVLGIRGVSRILIRITRVAILQTLE